MATRPSALRAFREALAATSVRSNPAARKKAAGSPAALGALSEALQEMSRRFLLVEPKDVPDADLVAVLLAGAVEGDPAEASTALLGDVQGNLARVARGEGFARRKGFSDLAFARMTAAAELIKRAERRAAVEGLGGQVTGPAEAERIARAYVGGPREQVGALFFDNQLRLLGFRILSMGGQTMTVADPREVVIAALEMRAKVVILVHNHPSGVPSPSSEDDTTTARLKEILRLLGMQLADHIILGKGGDTYSYAMSMRLNPRRRNPPQSVKYDREEGELLVSPGYAVRLTKLGKMQSSPARVARLAELVPERATHAFALHPENWASTFASLSGKDRDKVMGFKPEAILLTPDTLVGEMKIASRYLWHGNEEDALAYRDSVRRLADVDIRSYRQPELLVPRTNPRRRNPVTGAFSHDEGEQGTGEEIAGTLHDEPVGSIIVFPTASALNKVLLREEFARFRGLPRGKVGWLGGMELPESSRNKGHGQAIVSAMLDEARSLGVRSVVLHADSFASQRFWARMGFVEQDTLPEDVRRGLWMTPMVKVL